MVFQQKDRHVVVAIIVEDIATIIPNNIGYIYRLFPIYLVYLYMFPSPFKVVTTCLVFFKNCKQRRKEQNQCFKQSMLQEILLGKILVIGKL